MKISINRFYKDEDGWFIDLPEWTGNKEELAMIRGADTLLEIMAEGKEEIIIKFSDTFFDNSEIMSIIKEGNENEGGAYYSLDEYQKKDYYLTIWLCDVTKFIFNGNMPKKIYIAKN